MTPAKNGVQLPKCEVICAVSQAAELEGKECQGYQSPDDSTVSSKCQIWRFQVCVCPDEFLSCFVSISPWNSPVPNSCNKTFNPVPLCIGRDLRFDFVEAHR